jgi:hypothetical protein
VRKRILPTTPVETPPTGDAWLALAPLAQVEVSSEEPGFPIEAALEPRHASGWRAAARGAQTVRLLFDAPQRLRRIWLRFQEPTSARTQEFVLRWSPDRDQSFRELVRQQWTFSPAGATMETEDYRVALEGVTILELIITPDIAGGSAPASLAEWRLA